MVDLAVILALAVLAFFLSRRYYRRIIGACRRRENGALASASVSSQANYFATATSVYVLIAGGLASLLARFWAERIATAHLREKLAGLLASGGETAPAVPVDLLIDKIRNRAAFPDLYTGQPADVLIDNAISWQLEIGRVIDSVALTAIAAAATIACAWKIIGCRRHSLAPQYDYERLVQRMLKSVSAVAVLCSAGIIATLLIESALFFSELSVIDFLFGTHWNPQVAIRDDQTAAQGAFGFIPLLSGTVLISAIAIGIAFPVGLIIAVYTSEYASGWQRNMVKPTLEILTGIPTVVYGAFAAIFAGPWLKAFFGAMGLDATVESALAVGVIMGIMIIPLVSSLMDDTLRQIPNSIREAMLAIGATRFELITMVLLPSSLPGMVGSLLLAISRAFGETMIVVMAAGLTAQLTFNPLEAVTTVTVQIATILVGDQAFDSIKTLSAFALGLTLFLITLSLNVLASWVSNRFKVVYQ